MATTLQDYFRKIVGYSRPRVFSIVFFLTIFYIAFFFSPYWILPDSRSLRIFLFLFILGAGFFWSVFSAGKISGKITKKDAISFFVLLISIFLLNFLPLFSPIAWRGDEPSHVDRILKLLNLVSPIWVVSFFLFFTLILILVIKKPKVGFPLWILFLISAILLFIVIRPINATNSDITFLLRYPFANYWVIAVFPAIGSFINSLYSEPLFRIMPLLSTVAITWVFTRELEKSNKLIAWLWAMAIATIPLVFYYSSILYLEMPAVLLMCVVFANLDALLFSDAERVKNCTGWIALLLIGFVKETTVFFLFAYLFFRWGFFIVRKYGWLSKFLSLPKTELGNPAHTKKRMVLGEVNIAFSVLFPALFYLLLRACFRTFSRGYSPDIHNLLQISNYKVMFTSYVDQFGAFFLLFLVSLIFLALSRKKFLVITYLGFFFFDFLFFAMDNKSYLGYSRFNLFILPIILAATTFLILSLSKKSWPIYVLLILLIGINVIKSPILMDGTKKPFWGEYRSNISEHYYPYPQVLLYILENKPDSNVLFADFWRQYDAEFYFSKFHWWPKYKSLVPSPPPVIIPNEDDWSNIDSTLLSARNEGYDSIIYHILGSKIPELAPIIEKYNHQLFCNKAHCLLLFTAW